MSKNEWTRRFLRNCSVCGKFRLKLREYTWWFLPGSGRIRVVCEKCWNNRPKNFDDRMGIISTPTKKVSKLKLIKHIGSPKITDDRYGNNAYGSMLSEYNDGRILPIICGHGGSEWLCLECAQKIEEAI